jgi:AraC family transcriptional regulator
MTAARTRTLVRKSESDDLVCRFSVLAMRGAMSISTAPTGLPEGIAIMKHRRRLEPEYVVCGNRSINFYAAKWRLPAHRVRTDCRMDNILISRRRGAARLTKTVGGKAERSYALPGAFTFIPSGDYAHYNVGGESEFLELYVAPELLQEFADQHELGNAGIKLRPVLAQSDPWLAGYFQMLESEIELYHNPIRTLDVLLLGQAQQLLLAHLVRSYAGLKPSKRATLDGTKSASALRPELLSRVYEYIDANLTEDIHLTHLAQLVHLSERHFIRAFRAATGCTPYRYLVDKRLQACARVLIDQPELPITDVASAMRFRSRPHFTAMFSERFGITPSEYRNVGQR